MHARLFFVHENKVQARVFDCAGLFFLQEGAHLCVCADSANVCVRVAELCAFQLRVLKYDMSIPIKNKKGVVMHVQSKKGEYSQYALVFC